MKITVFCEYCGDGMEIESDLVNFLGRFGMVHGDPKCEKCKSEDLPEPEKVDLEPLEEYHLQDFPWLSATVNGEPVCLLTQKGMAQISHKIKELEDQVDFLKGEI